MKYYQCMKYNISWRAVDSGKWQIEGGSITSYLPNNSIVGPASVTVTAAFVRNQTILQNKSTIVEVLHHFKMTLTAWTLVRSLIFIFK